MNYMGSKARIVKDFLPIILKELPENGTFVDLFCGGGNVVRCVPPTYKRIANDKNNYLMAMWYWLAEGQEFADKIDREYYNRQRELFHLRKFQTTKECHLLSDAEIGWAGFMGSFNGRFFDGGYAAGGENENRSYISEHIRGVRKQISSMKGIRYFSCDYSEVPLPANSVIYCDIPYKDTKQYSVSRNFQYERFYDWCRQKAEEGYKIFVSEYCMPDDFTCVWQKEITNSMNQTNTHRRVEKLFTLQ